MMVHVSHRVVDSKQTANKWKRKKFKNVRMYACLYVQSILLTFSVVLSHIKYKLPVSDSEIGFKQKTKRSQIMQCCMHHSGF